MQMDVERWNDADVEDGGACSHPLFWQLGAGILSALNISMKVLRLALASAHNMPEDSSTGLSS